MIGKRLKWIRKGKGLTQQAFSKPLQTSSGYISEVEQGKKAPGSDFLLSLMRVWGISINWLLTGKGDPYLHPASKEGPNGEERPSSPEGLSKSIETGEAKILRQLRDKSYAMDISLSLAELERLKPEAFKEVAIFIKGLLAGVRIMSPESQEYAGPRSPLCRAQGGRQP